MVGSYLMALLLVGLTAVVVGRKQRASGPQEAMIGEEEEEEEEARLQDGDQLEGEVEAYLPGEESQAIEMTEKRMKKAARKQEKKEIKRARAEAIRAHEQRKRQAEAARNEREALKEEERLEKAEQARLERQEKAAAEEALYRQWKGKISVEQQGSSARQQACKDINVELEKAVRNRKVVYLEELAGEFGLQTSKIVDRLRQLEASGRIPGVFDDRGKFVHINASELESIAQYIERKGRVGVSELANASNRMVSLT